ncbi:MAG: hypothetical protein JW800_02800 [Candidatus Omnitrophica bacterium]|nr:hypothetical protein [Candidatus Omnitrophota bacterium]
MRRCLLPIVILIIFQAIFSFVTFPVHKLDIERPILFCDHAFHYYQTILTIDLLKTSKRLWGYDPRFMAGYPTAVANMSCNFGAAFATGVLSIILPLAVASKVFLMAMIILMPVITYFSCRNLFFNRSESFLAGLVLVYLLSHFTKYNLLVRLGLYSFVFSMFLALFTFTYFFRYLKTGEKKVLVYYLLTGWYSITLHPMSSVAMFFFVAFYLAFERSKISAQKLKHLFGASILIVLGNLYWLMPLIRFSNYYHPGSTVMMEAHGWKELIKQTIMPANIITVSFLCAILSPILLRKEQKKNAVILTLWATFLSLFFIAFIQTGPIARFFSHIEPGRFDIILAVVAPILTSWICSKIFKLRTKILIMALSALMCVQMLFWYKIPAKEFIKNKLFYMIRFFPEPFLNLFKHDIRNKGGEYLVNSILSLTDNSGRILMEHCMGGNTILCSQFTGMLQELTKREFMAGPYFCLRIVHSYFQTLTEGNIFSRPIETIEIERFMEYMDLYNIKWAFINNKVTKEYFKSHPKYFRLLSSYKNMDIYLVAREASYFIKGEGSINASLDKITITNASKGDIILKYHYLDTLKTRQGLKVERYDALDDPVGFIKINNYKGYDKIEIYN